jgi:hypothetical protein
MAPPPHRVTDLRDLLEADGKPAAPVRRLALWLGSIVECVTSMGDQERWVPVAVGCAHCDAGRMAPLAVRCVGPGIEWLCSECRASGTLRGFQGTPFDLSEVDDDLAEDADVAVFARLPELDAVRQLELSPGDRRALSLAVLVREHVVLGLTTAELAHLIDSVRRGAAGATGPLRHAAERFVGRCDAAQLMFEARGMQTPLVH